MTLASARARGVSTAQYAAGLFAGLVGSTPGLGELAGRVAKLVEAHFDRLPAPIVEPGGPLPAWSWCEEGASPGTAAD